MSTKEEAAMELEAVIGVAKGLSLDPTDLYLYYTTDELPGWKAGVSPDSPSLSDGFDPVGFDPRRDPWPAGSIPTPEARMLYALVREVKPRAILEAGRFLGCSTMHIAQAIKANPFGLLTTIDKEAHPGYIPSEYRPCVYWKIADATTYIPNYSFEGPYEFVFEDLDHTYGTTRRFWENILPYTKRGALLVCHDWFEPAAIEMKTAYLEVVGEPDATFHVPEISSCGLAMKRYLP